MPTFSLNKPQRIAAIALALVFFAGGVLALRLWPDASGSRPTLHAAGPASSTPRTTLIPLTPTAPPPDLAALPVGDLPGWHQVFRDDFTVDVPLGSFPEAVADRWGNSYPDGWHDTSGNGTYFPSKVVSIQNGVMDLYLHTENGVHLVAAPVPTIPESANSKGGILYGRYVVRFRSDPVPGYKTAWLLWPDSGIWPRDGEIDFPEGNLDGFISAYMHYQNGTSGSDQNVYSTEAAYMSWHTAVIEWTPTACTFILDGQMIGTSTSRIPDTPMHWVLQTETDLNGIPPRDSAAGHVQIDWVAVYIPD
jgi:beta-glucanase (GH16 family)